VLANPDDCVGEIVNTAGGGPFEGYYNNAEATSATLRNGWYWSGDLGYMDDEGHLWFAGRTADWIRVDGENFPAGPIEAALSRHPDVVVAAAYGVPDEQAGDQVMAALRQREGTEFDPVAFAAYVDALPEVGPKWRPRFVRVVDEFPMTGTNKIVKRTLVREKYRRDLCGEDALWIRERGADSYRPFTADDEDDLFAALKRAGRERFWDL
jgi:fatty-acyl-CoA synthase